eukprot:CAMPEP_0117422332 /NCGR_PEP_ID=MMETSP0758-20121206/3198_1 /TAXON_ID=63605 /ORGANISM="Percolomonas cosmopolitus, Strain AE-1 (ATCC 50343)" /LENGTH=912 /DNA_ID=CAMNT_0005204899 /DNA_START=652 /DNA_END=3390 /DNA_ORIENTATION=+
MTIEKQLSYLLKKPNDKEDKLSADKQKDNDELVAAYSKMVLSSTNYTLYLKYLFRAHSLFHFKQRTSLEYDPENEKDDIYNQLSSLFQGIHRVMEAEIPISTYTKMHPIVFCKQLPFFHKPSAFDFQTAFGNQTFEGDTVNDEWVFMTSFYYHLFTQFANEHLNLLIRALKVKIAGTAELESVQFHPYSMTYDQAFESPDREKYFMAGNSEIMIVIFKFKKNEKVKPLITAIVPDKVDIKNQIYLNQQRKKSKHKNNPLADKPPLKDRKTSDTDTFMKHDILNRIDNYQTNIGLYIGSNIDRWWKDNQKLTKFQFNSLCYQLMNLVYDLFVASVKNNWETSYILNVFNVGYEIDKHKNIKLSYQRSPIVVNNHFRVIMTSIALSLTKGSIDNYDDSCIYHRVFKHVPTMIGFHLKYQLWLLIKSFTLSHDDFMFSLTNPLYKKLPDGSSKDIGDCFPSGSNRYGQDTNYVNAFMKLMEEQDLKTLLARVHHRFVNFHFLNDEPTKIPSFMESEIKESDFKNSDFKKILDNLKDHVFSNFVMVAPLKHSKMKFFQENLNDKDTATVEEIVSYAIKYHEFDLISQLVKKDDVDFNDCLQKLVLEMALKDEIHFDLLSWMAGDFSLEWFSNGTLLEAAFDKQSLPLFHFAKDFKTAKDTLAKCLASALKYKWEVGYFLLINSYTDSLENLKVDDVENSLDALTTYAERGDHIRVFSILNANPTDEKYIDALFSIAVKQNDCYLLHYLLHSKKSKISMDMVKEAIVTALKLNYTQVIRMLLNFDENEDLLRSYFFVDKKIISSSYEEEVVKKKETMLTLLFLRELSQEINVIQMVSDFVEWGADITQKNGDGQSPLYLAATSDAKVFRYIYDLMKKNKNKIDRETRDKLKSLMKNSYDLETETRNFLSKNVFTEEQ